MIDWANYFVAHCPQMPPIPSGEARMISLQAGMALKRRALPREIPAWGFMEFLHVGKLLERGETLVANGEIVVQHVQSHGFWNTFAVHYHNGRSIAGFRKLESRTVPLLLRIASCGVLPAFLVFRSLASVVPKRRFLWELALSLPLMAGLACCHAAGELVGYCAGPGTSPERLS
jgi:hypothetical protein